MNLDYFYTKFLNISIINHDQKRNNRTGYYQDSYLILNENIIIIIITVKSKKLRKIKEDKIIYLNVLDITIAKDIQETEDTKERVSNLLEKLKNKSQGSQR